MAHEVLVVEDDDRLAAAMRRALAYDGHRVTVVGDGAAALDLLRRSTPDLVVLDRMLPGLDGVDLVRRIRAAGDDVAVLMVTARDAVADRVVGLDAGADDYLVKPFAHDELLARARALLRRGTSTRERDRLRIADLVLDPPAMTAVRGGRELALTPVEYRLLVHLLRNAGIVLSRSAILADVWGMDSRTASNVVDVYIGYLRRKLETDGASRLIHAVRGVGYVLRESP